MCSPGAWHMSNCGVDSVTIQGVTCADHKHKGLTMCRMAGCQVCVVERPWTFAGRRRTAQHRCPTKDAAAQRMCATIIYAVNQAPTPLPQTRPCPCPLPPASCPLPPAWCTQGPIYSLVVDGGTCRIQDSGKVSCEQPTITFKSTPLVCNLPYKAACSLTVRVWPHRRVCLVCGVGRVEDITVGGTRCGVWPHRDCVLMVWGWEMDRVRPGGRHQVWGSSVGCM